MDTENVIDDSSFNALMDLGGKEFVIQMVDAFLKYAPKVIGEARKGLSTGDLEPALRMGHSLHSSARTIGVVRMKTLGDRIEKAARERLVSELPSLVDEMEQVFIQAKSCLEEKKAGL